MDEITPSGLVKFVTGIRVMDEIKWKSSVVNYKGNQLFDNI